MTRFLAGLLMMALASLTLADSGVVGLWKTIDDETGEAKSWVRIFERDGKLYGTIEKLLLRPADAVCEPCKPPLKDKPIVGMEIINGLTKNGFYYSKGEVLDPGNGKFYKCKIWLENERVLNVRGYIGFLYRTQKWYRVSDVPTEETAASEG